MRNEIIKDIVRATEDNKDKYPNLYHRQCKLIEIISEKYPDMSRNEVNHAINWVWARPSYLTKSKR